MYHLLFFAIAVVQILYFTLACGHFAYIVHFFEDEKKINICFYLCFRRVSESICGRLFQVAGKWILILELCDNTAHQQVRMYFRKQRLSVDDIGKARSHCKAFIKTKGSNMYIIYTIIAGYKVHKHKVSFSILILHLIIVSHCLFPPNLVSSRCSLLL